MAGKHTKWTARYVERAHEAQMVVDCFGIQYPVPLPPGTELLYSPRAEGGTAELEMYGQEMIDNPARVAPVLRVGAGFGPDKEYFRYVTLVSVSADD